MAKIYQLMTGKKQIGEVVYDEREAIAHAKQIAGDTGETVTIWEAEVIDDRDYDLLEWTQVGTIWPMIRWR